MDIGCYLVNTSRFIFGREPLRVTGALERDPDMRTDRLTSILLDFGTGHAAGTCSTQMVPYQNLQILGTTGRIELPDSLQRPTRPAQPHHRRHRCRVPGGGRSSIDVHTCNQYTIQGDLFSKAILDGRDVPVLSKTP